MSQLLKRFPQLPDWCRGNSSVNLPFKVDGLVFAPKSSMMALPLLKWKPQHQVTIDFLLRGHELLIWDSEVGQHTPSELGPLLGRGGEPTTSRSGQVVECEWCE